jgi:HKD family nuclease
MVEIIHNNWLDFFLRELKDTKQVLIISPFITRNIVDHLLDNRVDAEVKLITRFNLNDFRARVSSLSALKKLVDVKVEIKGIQGLHSKVYIFDSKSVIIGSANFTSGGFFSNYEFGVLSKEADTVKKSIEYFNSLWKLDTESLTTEKINSWKEELESATPHMQPESLSDYGKKATVTESDDKQYIIKFFGKTEHREGLSFTSREEIEGSHCHWALTFSGRRGPNRNGRPRKYRDGDIVYMARMLEGRDYAIFGKGIALRHVDERDVASEEDIEEIDWKEEWPVYIRVYNTEFIDGTMADCPKFSEFFNELKYDCFPTTQAYHARGIENINPWDSLRQQADIKLSEIGAEWVEAKFQEAKQRCGAVPEEFLLNLYPGTPTIDEVMKRV